MQTNQRHRARALIIDDSRVDKMILEEMLNALGCQVDVACDRTYLSMVDNGYELIFLDVHMPTQNGFEVARAIRESSYTTKDIPIIAVSADQYSMEQIDAAEACGINGYLEKPVNLQLLEHVVHTFLQHNNIAMEELSSQGSGRLKGFMQRNMEEVSY